MDTYPVDVVYFLVDVIENLKADNDEDDCDDESTTELTQERESLTQHDKGTYLLLSEDGKVLAVSGNSEFDDIDKPPMGKGVIVCVTGTYELTTSEEDKQEETPEEKALTRIADTLPRYCGRVDRSEVENAMDALDYAEAEENNEMREGWRQHLLNEMAMLRSENPDSNVEIDAIVELLQQLAA